VGVTVVAVPTSPLNRSARPGAEPASSWNDPPAPVHSSVTDVPTTVEVSPCGAAGSWQGVPTVTIASLEGLLVPAALRARTRTK